MGNTDAFIAELEALMDKYNATIGFDFDPSSNITGEYMSVCVGDEKEHKIVDGPCFRASDIL